MSEMENPSAIAEFEGGGNDKFAPRTIGAELVASREAQEVQVAMVAAKRFPRDPMTSYQKIMQDCDRKSLAAKAIYEYPRGGSRISGPSIHLARALARGWGNLDSGFKVLDDNGKRATVMAYCWDLETNFREAKVFDVSHMRQTKSGSYALTDPRDIYENIANHAARRERACILSVIPADIVEAAIGRCQMTLVSGDKVPLADRIRNMITAFAEFGVTPEMLEDFIGYKKEAFSPQTLVRLGSVYNSLRDGVGSVEQFFDMSKAALSATPEPAQMPESATPEQQKTPEPKKKMGLDDL